MRATVRQPRLEHDPGRGIGNRVTHAGKHPAMIEQDEVDPDARVARNLQPGVKVGKEMRIESGRETAIVIDNAGAAVAEEEPARHGESQRRHLLEVARHRVSARRNAKMRTPHVRTEIQPVEDCLAVGGPRVIASMQEHQM